LKRLEIQKEMKESLARKHKTLKSMLEEIRSEREERLFPAFNEIVEIHKLKADEKTFNALEEAFFTGVAVAMVLFEDKLLQTLSEFDDKIVLRKDVDPLTIFLVRFLKFIHGDVARVNEWEETIIKMLKEFNLSYRDISKIIDRSTETIHRVLK